MLGRRLFTALLFVGFSLTLQTLQANEHAAPEGHGESSGHGAPEGGGHGAGPAEPHVEVSLHHEDGIRITESPDEIQIPGKIFELASVHGLKPTLLFVPVAVTLKEKNPGILKKPEIRIEYPRGGGSLDLSQWLTGKQGSFYVRFEFEEGMKEETKKFFFVSRVRRRKVENEVLGAGCKTFMEVKKALLHAPSADGLLVNTTRNRHLGVLGGSFVFTALLGKDLRLSQISFTDRTQPEYFCPSVVASEEKKTE